uniref:EDR1/CTR1/ARMC3-like peptidase-like domain-containing protein n=1 Tax=Glossina palpalis gambiensis TaxID=67801 RepID=A0A1B0BZ58_9MUSC
MSKSGQILRSLHTYKDRRKSREASFHGLTISLGTIETLVLLFNSDEDIVLAMVLKHLTEFVRKNETNIESLKEKNVLNALKLKEFYRESTSTTIKRLALYVATAIIESSNTLQELESSENLEIIELCLKFYGFEDDDICLEYLSVMFNSCIDDPQGAKLLLTEVFIDKFFDVVSNTNNPDTELHSFQILEKLLWILGLNDLKDFFAKPSFPINRLLCDLTNDFIEIRIAALNVIELLITDTSETNPFASNDHIIHALQQLTKMYCEDLMLTHFEKLIDVLAAAIRNENMALLFFELNLFDSFLVHLNQHMLAKYKCYSLMIIAEAAKYPKFLERLVQAEVTDKFLICLIYEDLVGPHILLGLNRLIKSSGALKRILEAYDENLLEKLLSAYFEYVSQNQEILTDSVTIKIKAREQAAEFLGQLLTIAYHKTASRLMELRVPDIMATIFGQPSEWQSIDYYLSLLCIIESLAQNADYREELCACESLTTNIANLLMVGSAPNSFNTLILVSSIFRTLCCLVDEDVSREILLHNYISASVKRGLKCSTTLVKTSVTNFIMQTSRFPEFVSDYIENGVLETLVMHQKHSHSVPTWNTAIESILSKDPTLKFCIRHHLGFTDTTAGHDFFVSKKKFDDFRDLQNMLKDEVSPLAPILVVNFNRPEDDPSFLIQIPRQSLTPAEILKGTGSYCRRPRDTFLPEYLEEINAIFEKQGLAVNPAKMKRCIDFENVAKRAKLIAQLVSQVLGNGLKTFDLNSDKECSDHIVKAHLKDLARETHTTFLPLGRLRSGCQFERAILFKALADQVGLPCTMQRSVDGRLLFNELPLPLEMEHDPHCSLENMQFTPWRTLRPTHIIDLMYNVGDLYPVQSRQALQYLRLY